MVPAVKRDFRLPRLVLLVVLVVLCWLVCTVAQVEKYVGLPQAWVVCALGCTGVALLLLLLRKSYRRNADIPRSSLIIAFCILVSSFAVLYPKSQHHAPGKGSDREDALRVELIAVLHHRYPYDARTFLGHAPTPLPGAMWLAMPFFFVGRIALQNVFWAGAFFVFLAKFYARRSTALVFVVVFLLTSLENLNDIDVGGDYVTNIMYVCIAIYVFGLAVEDSDSTTKTWLATIFLGISLSSRILYLVVMPLLFALAIQRTRLQRALWMVGGVLVTWSLVTFPVFSPHPVTKLIGQLNQNADKLRQLPQAFAGITLPLLALLVASTSFLLHMNVRRVFLLAGAASLILVLPPMISIVQAEGGLTRPMTADLEYLAVSAVFLSLWAMSTWEQSFNPNDVDNLGIPTCPKMIVRGHSL